MKDFVRLVNKDEKKWVRNYRFYSKMMATPMFFLSPKQKRWLDIIAEKVKFATKHPDSF